MTMQMAQAQNYQMQTTNLYDTLKDTAQKYPQKCALIDMEHTLTYQQLLQQTDSLADYLAGDCGVQQGDRVAFLMTNSIRFCVAFYAVAKLGAIVCPISTKLQAAEIERFFCDLKANILFCDYLWQEKAECAVRNSSIHTILWDRLPERVDEACRHESMSTLLQRRMDCIKSTAVQNAQLPVVIMYTSGTTGKPKGVTISHESILQNIYAYQDILKLDEQEITLISVPMFHITGLSCVMALFILIGGTSVLTPFFRPNEALEYMRRYEVTHYHAVPTVYIMLTRAAKREQMLPKLRTAVCGGGFIAPEDIASFIQIAPNTSFHPAYGMTETAGAGVLFPTDYLSEDKPRAAGRVMPNTYVKVVDDQLEELPIGMPGQICLGGSVVTKAYWNLEHPSNLRAGWLLTGDMGLVDEDGYVYILDRIKDSINRGGEKIYSLEIESEIKCCAGVKQVAVFGIPDQVYGEIPVAAVVPEKGVVLQEEIILKQLRSKLAKYKIPQQIVFYTELPCTASGKIKKQELRERLQEKHLMWNK